MSVTFQSLQDFADRFPKISTEFSDEAQFQLLKAGHNFARRQSIRASRKAQDTGEMMRSWSQEKPTRKGQSKHVSSFKNVAPHAGVIDQGRFRSIPGVKKSRKVRQGRTAAAAGGAKSRLYGSPELPRGITRPVTEKLKAKGDALAATAIQKAERKFS